MLDIDRIISEFDKGLRTILNVSPASRPVPGGDLPDPDLNPEDRRRAAALMRVNHCGEVCAQALYQGQALASQSEAIRQALGKAAREEADHLAWSEQRIAELGGRTSLLNPLWYGGALAIGLIAGRLGDQWNLGFLAETEIQVERHLQGHLDRLNPRDVRTRAIVEAMRTEEAGHAHTARQLGARELPGAVKGAMLLAAGVMTTTSYWI